MKPQYDDPSSAESIADAEEEALQNGFQNLHLNEDAEVLGNSNSSQRPREDVDGHEEVKVDLSTGMVHRALPNGAILQSPLAGTFVPANLSSSSTDILRALFPDKGNLTDSQLRDLSQNQISPAPQALGIMFSPRNDDLSSSSLEQLRNNNRSE